MSAGQDLAADDGSRVVVEKVVERDDPEKDGLIALVEDALRKGATQTAALVLDVVNDRMQALARLEREHAELVEEVDEFYVAVDDCLPDIDVDGEGGEGNRVERIEFAGAALEAQNRIIEEWRDKAMVLEHERDMAIMERDRALGEIDRTPRNVLAPVVMERQAWGGAAGVFTAEEVVNMVAWAEGVLGLP